MDIVKLQAIKELQTYATEEAPRVATLVKAGQVQRFHAEPRVPAQSVGEHTYGVTIIAEWINLDASVDFLKACLYHDAPELFTGDIPFTAKRGCLSKLCKALEEVEEEIFTEWLLPNPQLNHRENAILKLADMLEGLRYVKYHEGGSQQSVADRWWHAIISLLLSPQCFLNLYHSELVRAYEILRQFTPEIHSHRMYATVWELYKANNVKTNHE